VALSVKRNEVQHFLVDSIEHDEFGAVVHHQTPEMHGVQLILIMRCELSQVPRSTVYERCRRPNATFRRYLKEAKHSMDVQKVELQTRVEQIPFGINVQLKTTRSVQFALCFDRGVYQAGHGLSAKVVLQIVTYTFHN
jgi:hypothetical protein